MEFQVPLVEGVLVKRYKRFLADIRLNTGEMVTAHCPNSGSMMGLVNPGSPVRLSVSRNPKRKLNYTWEMVKADGVWVGINTNYPTRLVIEGFEQGSIPEFASYRSVRKEVTAGNSRLDLHFTGPRGTLWVELKNVTLVSDNVARFPDAVTVRGHKHVRELTALCKRGEPAAIFFVIQREDVDWFTPADAIDPQFGQLLREAARQGVSLWAYRWQVSPAGIQMLGKVPVHL
ncbi:MAG: DNA/RNA nuclease SfsA [Calditrichaeota bacterium]|nr:DNA/RNA nuclease SfsA [Calditrichota bacterium]